LSEYVAVRRGRALVITCIHLDATIGRQQDQAAGMFCDKFQSLAKARPERNASAMLNRPFLPESDYFMSCDHV